MARLILASASPRRRELLALLGQPFEVVPGHVDEDRWRSPHPDKHVALLAEEKAQSVAESLGNDVVVIGADTIVVHENRILNKPSDAEDALRMLRSLSGKTHSVFTGVAVVSASGVVVRAVETRVTFRRVPDSLLCAYVGTGSPLDKAGGYGIQELAATFVERIEGDYFNVVGLPLQTLAQMLEEIEWTWWSDDTTL